MVNIVKKLCWEWWSLLSDIEDDDEGDDDDDGTHA